MEASADFFGFAVRPGAQVGFKDRLYIVRRLLTAERVLLEDPASQKSEVGFIDQLVHPSKIRYVESEEESEDEHGKPPELLGYSDQDVAKAEAKLEIIAPLLALNHRTREDVRTAALAAKKSTGIHSLFLRDSCSQCGMPFVPYRNDALMTSRCDRCAASLFRGPSQTASRSELGLQVRIRTLWDAALSGRSAALAAFHEALTLEATRNPIFSRSGEPWTFWRIDERRSLLVNVAEGCLDSCEALTGASSMCIGRKVRQPGSRHRFLPREPSARAGILLKMAARVTFARRPAAKIEKSS